MAYLIPESLTRLTATAYANDAEISAMGREEILHETARKLAESALRKLMADCITTTEWHGHQGQALQLDVYVLSPSELNDLLRDALNRGCEDAMRWIRGIA